VRSLSTVNEHRLCIIDWNVEGHNCWSVGCNGDKAGVDASSSWIRGLNRLAWRGERGLCDRVIDL